MPQEAGPSTEVPAAPRVTEGVLTHRHSITCSKPSDLPSGTSQPRQAAGILGSSPSAQSSSLLLGTSPSNLSVSKDTSSRSAKKLFDRIRYDVSLDAQEWQVGYVQSEQQQERKSGVEAWSLRVHDYIVELPFSEFVARFAEDGIPYHRIAFFKQCGARVWESDQYKKRNGPGDGMPPIPPHHSTHADSVTPNMGRRTSSFTSHSPLAGSSFTQQYMGTPPVSSYARNMAREGAGDMSDTRSTTPARGPGSTRSTRQGGADGRRPPPRRTSSSNGFVRHSSSACLLGGSDDDDGAGASDDGGDDDELLLLGQRLDEDEEEDDDGDVIGEEEEEEGAVREVPLPEECWMRILEQLPVREICMMARVNKWLRQLCGSFSVWRQCHIAMFGQEPPADWNTATLRRACRRSQLRAARWVDALPVARQIGSSGTRCLAVDDSKVVSGDGAALRVWSHCTGRRIATLQGHTGRVTCVAFDEEQLVTGCTQHVVKVWAMDDLKCTRTLRGHEGPVTGVALLPGGIPVSCSEDGSVLVWDTASSQPILRLSTGNPVTAMHLQQPAGYLVAASRPGSLQIWDVSAAQLLHTLTAASLNRGDKTASQHPAGLDANELAQLHQALSEEGGLHGDDDEDAAGMLLVDEAAAQPAVGSATAPFTSVASSGNVLAAGRAEGVVLWDVSTQQEVACLDASTWQHCVKPLYTPSAAAPGYRETSSTGKGSQGAIARAAMRRGSQADGLNTLASTGTSPPTGFSSILMGSSPGSSTPLGWAAAQLQLHVGCSPPSPYPSVSFDSETLHGLQHRESMGSSAPAATNGPAPGGPKVSSTGSTSTSTVVPEPIWGCTSLQLDDWKLVIGLSDSVANRGAVVVHDVRAVTGSSHGSGVKGSWEQPVMVLHAPGRVHCLQFHGELLVAGVEGHECCVWTMEAPTSAAAHQAIATPAGMPPKQTCMAGTSAGAAAGAGRGAADAFGKSPQAGGLLVGEDSWERGGKGKKKPNKQTKKQTRYPKRNGK